MEEAQSAASILRWLRNFAAQAIVARVNGIAVGRADSVMDEGQREAQKDAVLRALDEAGPHDSVLADLGIGHTDLIVTIPCGSLAEIECDRATLNVPKPLSERRDDRAHNLSAPNDRFWATHFPLCTTWLGRQRLA